MKKIILITTLICGICFAQAQKVKGDLSCLKGQNEINITFDYTGVTYDGDSEVQYLKEEDLAKDPEWKAAWTSTYRTEKWHPRLIEDLNEYAGKKGMTCGEYPDAAYTIAVKFSDIDPGSFAGPFSVPAKISGTISFYKKGESTPFATLEFKNITGNSYAMFPRPELRVAEAMSCIGEMLGKTLSKIK